MALTLYRLDTLATKGKMVVCQLYIIMEGAKFVLNVTSNTWSSLVPYTSTYIQTETIKLKQSCFKRGSRKLHQNRTLVLQNYSSFSPNIHAIRQISGYPIVQLIQSNNLLSTQPDDNISSTSQKLGPKRIIASCLR